jgi:hypothetical protein
VATDIRVAVAVGTLWTWIAWSVLVGLLSVVDAEKSPKYRTLRYGTIQRLSGGAMTTVSKSTTPHVIVYGTGGTGSSSFAWPQTRDGELRPQSTEPALKWGRDVGDLAGIDGGVGVIVADCDTFGYTAVHADIAVVFVADRLSDNREAHERFLGAGLTVICHGTESYFPWGSDPKSATRIDTLARRNGVTFRVQAFGN